MTKVFCFGELLLRLSPQLNGEWIRQASLPVYIGGAELNVGTALATWEIPVAYCTALPDNYLSKEIVASIDQKKIDSKPVIFSGNRIGTYYLPQGADLKNTGVIYDRTYSAFAELKPDQVEWDKLLENISWFHFSAISPALNENIAILCKQALQEAEKRGIFVSVDLNYRAKLWQYGKKPVDVMPGLVQYCDLVMGNIWAAEEMLGITLPPKLKRTKDVLVQQSLKTSVAIESAFPRCKQVANTFRFDKDDGLFYYATLFRDKQLHVSFEQSTPSVVDKVGSGDCFMAGLIYGNHQQWASQQVIDFAAAAAFNKLFIKGDATTSSVEDINRSMLKYA